MRVHLLADWTGYDRREPQARPHKAGDEVSVYHMAGVKLINRRLAKWICQEGDDPPWEPAEPFRHKAAKPQFNRMVHGGMNR